jgi:hypothetical protein
MKPGHFGKWIRNIWRVSKRGAAEGWRISVGPFKTEMKCYKELRRKGTSSIKRNTANWIGHSQHRNCFLKHVTSEKGEQSDGQMGVKA